MYLLQTWDDEVMSWLWHSGLGLFRCMAGWLAGWRAKGTVVANGRTADWVELSHWGVGLESAIISEALGHYFMQKYEIFSFRFLTVVNGRKHVKDLSLGN